MPCAARRPCVQPGCPQLQPCPSHPKVAWRSQHHAAPVRSITGRGLQAARERLYTAQGGCCKTCGELVMLSAKTFIRDHIAPLAEGGQDVESNTQGLCAECSAVKTQAEARRGGARWR